MVPDDPHDQLDAFCSQSTRVSKRTGYVNIPHPRAAFFVHDRGERVEVEQRIKLRATCAKIKSVEAQFDASRSQKL
jgi:hypothetical protein